MPAETSTTGLSRRLASLSPGQRTVLHRYVLKSTANASTVEVIPLQPRGERRDFPLSSAQERMWFNHQWSPGQPLYNESFGLRIVGDLDCGRLEKAFDFVMSCHEIFTVTFHAEDGRPFQRLGGCEAPKLVTRDYGGLAEPQRENAYETEAHRLVREPFVLDAGPLFRAALWKVGQGEHRLVFAMHHIMFDGWSGGLFFRELFTAYNEIAGGRALQAPTPGPQYIDFAAWEQKHFDEAAAQLDRELEYWKEQLAGTLAPPRLPFDRQAPAGFAHRSGREAFVCPLASVEALKALAKESGATMFMALLAIFNLLLARYSGQEDMIVGLPTTNRTHSALSRIIGVFINMALFRTDLSGDVTFRELLDRVRRAALGAQANQEVPVGRVIRALGLNGEAGRSLVSVLFDLQKKSQSLIEVSGLHIQTMEVSNGLAKFDLVLSMEDSGEELKGILEYDAEKFEPETVRGLVRHFCRLMESTAALPDTAVGHLPLVTAGELADLERRGIETPEPCHHWAGAEVCLRAAEHPHAPALDCGADRRSYGELVSQAARVAAFLETRQSITGKHVALCLPGGLDFVVAQLAVMMAGGAFVPIDPADPAARRDFILRDSDAVLVVTNAASSRGLPPSMPSVCFDRDRAAIARCGALDPTPSVAPGDPAYLIYTSGSTGQPKGVVVSHGGLLNLIAWHRRAFGISARDRATQLASVAFDASIWEIWPYLSAGASLHFPRQEWKADPARLRDWLVEKRIAICFAPTPLAEELIALDWPANTALRCLLTGGDRLRRRPAEGLPFRFVNNYGPTENTVVTTSGVVSAAGANAPGIGAPIDNVWLRVVDRNLEPVPSGAAGELLVGGRSLAAGYWRRDSLTREKFVSLPDGRPVYRTGDLCRLAPRGEIEFLGRIDEQVKLRGCRVEPGEIEHALLAQEGVRDAVIDVRESAAGRRQIVAYIVPDGPPLIPEKLRRSLLDLLPGYMIPAHVIPIAAVPRTVNGKVDRKALPAPAADANPPSSEPCTAAQKRIAAIWGRLLQVSSPMVGDDFFESGGDSLLATRLVVGIREEFGVDVPLARMMSEPTISALAAYAEAAGTSHKQLPACVIPLKSGCDAVPPLFLAPPAAGSPACYAALAAALQSDRAVYGFEAPGLVAGTPVSNIPDQARIYIRALLTLQPEGPYYIAGWSLGGPVAFEIACQLRDAGRPVAYLGLIDAGLPKDGRLPGGLSWTRPMWWALSFPFTEHIPLSYATLHMLASWTGIRLPESWNAVWRDGLIGTGRFLCGLLAGSWRALRVFLASVRSLKGYRPRRFDGTATLFQTTLHGGLQGQDQVLPDNLRQWSRDVSVRSAPGSHMTLMLDPRIASAFAPQFEATLEAGVTSHKER